MVDQPPWVKDLEWQVLVTLHKSDDGLTSWQITKKTGLNHRTVERWVKRMTVWPRPYLEPKGRTGKGQKYGLNSYITSLIEMKHPTRPVR